MDKAKYVRIYTDEAGESHFEDLETELTFIDYAPPAAPIAVAPFMLAESSLWAGAPAEWESDALHPVPGRRVIVTTQGEYEVTASDGDIRRFPVGAVFLVEDTWGKGHRLVMIGETDTMTLVVRLPDLEPAGE